MELIEILYRKYSEIIDSGASVFGCRFVIQINSLIIKNKNYGH